MLYSTIVQAGQRNKTANTISENRNLFSAAKGSMKPTKKGLDRSLNLFLHIGSGGRIRTTDLRVMSPTSYQTAPPRIKMFVRVEINSHFCLISQGLSLIAA